MGKGGAVVGLNIGTNTIKAVELNAGRGGIEIAAIGIMPTPEETISGGVITAPDVLGRAVKDMLSQSGIRSKAVVSSVAGQNLVVRIIEVPKMSDTELKETMSFEVERQIPFAATEVIMDYKPLRESEENPEAQNMEVLFCAAQEDMINAHVETLEAAGLLPRAIDIEPLAAARAAVELLGESTSGETVALLNIGASVTDISVARNGLVTFTRGVPVAGDSLSQAIMDTFGVEKFEAERIKKEIGAAILTQEDLEAADFSGGALGAESADFSLPPGGTESGSAPDFDYGTAETDSHASAAPSGAPASDQFEMSPLSFDNPFLTPEASHPESLSPADNPFDLSTETPVHSLGAGVSDNPFDLSLEPHSSHGAEAAPAAGSPSHEVNPFDLSLDSPSQEAGVSPKPQDHAEPQPATEFSLNLDEPTPPASAPSPADSFKLTEEPTSPPGATTQPPAPAPAFTLDLGEPEPLTGEHVAPPAGGFDLSDGGAAAESGTTPGALFDLAPSSGGTEPTTAEPAVPTASPGMNPFLHGGQQTDVGAGETEDFLNQANPFADSVMTSSASPHTEATPQGVYQCLSPVLAEMVVEIRRSLEYYTSRYPNAVISRLVVLGGTARLKHLDKYLSNELGIRVVISNPFEQLTLRTKNVPPEYAEELGPTLAVSVGLALRDML